MSPPQPRVDVIARAATTGTVLVVLFFVASRLIPEDSALAELRRYLNLGREGNLPTWWSAGLLLATALLAGLAARGEPPVVARSWLAVAATAGLLSLDEASQVHERLDRLVAAVGISVPTYAWLLPGVLVVVVVGLVLAVLARGLPGPVARGLVLAAGVFLLGAVGVEAVHGATARDASTLVRVGLILLEETLELVGATVAVAVVGRHVGKRLDTAPVRTPALPADDPQAGSPS